MGYQPEWLVLFGQEYGPFITAGAVLIPASIALLAIFHNQKIARKKATIDLVMHQRQNDRLVEARKMVLAVQEAKGSFTQYVAQPHNTTENEKIFVVLNTYEFVASGIRENAFDEEIYKRMNWSVLVRDWDALEAYIIELRNSRSRPTLYQEFEWLAKRWKDIPLKIDHAP